MPAAGMAQQTQVMAHCGSLTHSMRPEPAAQRSAARIATCCYPARLCPAGLADWLAANMLALHASGSLCCMHTLHPPFMERSTCSMGVFSASPCCGRALNASTHAREHLHAARPVLAALPRLPPCQRVAHPTGAHSALAAGGGLQLGRSVPTQRIGWWGTPTVLLTTAPAPPIPHNGHMQLAALTGSGAHSAVRTLVGDSDTGVLLWGQGSAGSRTTRSGSGPLVPLSRMAGGC